MSEHNQIDSLLEIKTPLPSELVTFIVVLESKVAISSGVISEAPRNKYFECQTKRI